ncbi:MAG: hypothetical protein DMF63_08655 [Acidobacteria bacterium]|nr:MAG: hypothetical protein DMF63_08655 [Acidobacteriota bacterium]
MDEDERIRTEITIETQSVTRIRTISGTGSFCSDCREIVIAILDSQAARAIGTNEEHIASLRLSGEIHEIEKAAICSASLARYVRKEKL